MPRVALRKFPCHAWHQISLSCATRGPPAWFSYQTWPNAARSAPRPVYVPRVACTPPAPPPARLTCHAWTHSARAAPWRCMCHTWHERRTAPPLPAHVLVRVRVRVGVRTLARLTCQVNAWRPCATRGDLYHAWHMITAPPLRAHVPRVASLGTHCPCQGICHTWHARFTRRPCRVPAHVPRVARTPHPPPSAWRMCRAWHVRRALRLAHVPRVARTPRSPPGACMCRAWHVRRAHRRLPGARATFHRTRRLSPCFCAMRGLTPHAPPVCHAWHMAITPLTMRGTCVKRSDATRGTASQILVPLVGEDPTRGA